MADYKKMYLQLFNDVSKVIEILQTAQQNAEEIYISSEDAPLTLLKSDGETDKETEDE